MIERVARALCFQDDTDPDRKNEFEIKVFGREKMWTYYVPEAKAAIEAMREPTDDMLYDGAESHVRYYDEVTEPECRGADPMERDIAQLHDAYDAMISTALDGK
jgi:hypothetical protein